MARNLKIPIILAIDTSCDDTSIALVQGDIVLVNVVASQTQLHRQFGGVFPTAAKQAHKENIGPAIQTALRRTGLGFDEIAGIAVTVGPGLAPALEVGINKAKDLAREHKKPFIAVNHIEGHLLSPLAKRDSKNSLKSKHQVNFPVLGVVISGGHSEFILVKAWGDYERLGFKIDDAAGECLDKIGRMLGLGYPAGAIIEDFAKKGDSEAYEFPLPMTQSGDFNLSFSGLKTFARNLIAKLEKENDGKLTKKIIYDICASAQKGVFRHITHKLEKVLGEHRVKEIWLGGGVAANVELKKVLRFMANTHGLKFRAPFDKRLCSDNAAMIGLVAGQKLSRGEIETDLEKVDRQPRWRVGEEL